MFRSLAFAAALVALPSLSWAADITVRMEDSDYVPASVDARVGDTLVFVNEDVLEHEVLVLTPGHGVDLGKQAPGDVAELPLGKAGSFEAECVFHPQMHLEVHVSP